MSTPDLQNCVKALQAAQSVLLVCQSPLDGDSLGSALGLALTLEKLGKKTTVHCSAGVPKDFKFLPTSDRVSTEFASSSNEFVITLDCSKTELDRLKYKPDGDKINIIITPKQGGFKAQDVSFPQATPQYDVAVTLDCADLKMTGRFAELVPTLPKHTKIINLDHHATNNRFGHYNYIDPQATSAAEVTLQVIDALAEAEGRKTLLDADIATCLITGIITDTGSFQNSNTKSSSFMAASRLLKVGARQQDVIKYLFKTKELNALHLWGKILSRLREEPDIKMVYSWVTNHDYEETGADQESISGIIDKLMTSVPGTRFAMLIRDVPGEKTVKGSLRSCYEGVNVAEIAQLFGGGGHIMAAGFKIPDATIGSARENILETIRRHQRSLLQSKLLKKQAVSAVSEDGTIDIPAAEPDEASKPDKQNKPNSPTEDEILDLNPDDFS